MGSGIEHLLLAALERAARRLLLVAPLLELPPGGPNALKWAAMETAGSSTRGSGWAPRGPVPPWEC